MRFGLRLIEYLGTPRDIVEMTAMGEEAGFDICWYPHDTFMNNTLVLTSAAAMATSRIQLAGVGITPYSTDPAELATYLTTLDKLSNGRAVLGLGVHTTDFIEWTGFSGADVLDRTREAALLIRRLLKGEHVAFDGKVFHWTDDCYLRSKPLRDEIPIYIAAFGDEYLELSGEIGDGSLPMMTPPGAARAMMAPIERGIAKNPRGRENYVISGCLWLSLSEERTEAARIMRDMAAYFGPYLEEKALNAIGLTSADFDPIRAAIALGDYDKARALVTPDMLKLGIVGTPKDVIGALEMLFDAGVDEVNLGGPLGPDPRQAIRLMGEKVIPHFRR